MDFLKNTYSKAKDFWNNSSNKKKALQLFFTGIALLTLIIFSSWSSPTDFPTTTTIQIKSGMTLGDAAHKLKSLNYIRSEFWFKAFVTVLGGPRSIVAGDYYFNKKQTLISIARRVVDGNYGLTQARITIPEGLSNVQIAKLFKEKFSLFDEEIFLN